MTVLIIFTSCIILVTILYFSIILLIDTGIFRLKRFVTSGNFPVTRVSIIIPARDEESSIVECLFDLEYQDYPKHLLEIVVVDDHSTDLTAEKVDEFIQSHPGFNLRLIPVVAEGNNQAFKKHSIRTGVDATSGEIVITTDADTRLNPGWISAMVDFHEQFHPGMIIGPVAFGNDSSFFGQIQCLEFSGLMAATAGSCRMGFPLMCNGANLAFTRRAYLATRNLEDDLKYPSGDDLFLMMKIRKEVGAGSVRYLFSEQAVVYTEAKRTLRKFFSQRLRWVSKSRGYPDPGVKAVAIVTWLFNFLLLSGMIGGIFELRLLFYSLFIFGLKILIELPAVWKIMTLTGSRRTLYLYPLTQVLNLVYVTGIGILGNVIPYEWKGRKVSPLKSGTRA